MLSPGEESLSASSHTPTLDCSRLMGNAILDAVHTVPMAVYTRGSDYTARFLLRFSVQEWTPNFWQCVHSHNLARTVLRVSGRLPLEREVRMVYIDIHLFLCYAVRSLSTAVSYNVSDVCRIYAL